MAATMEHSSLLHSSCQVHFTSFFLFLFYCPFWRMGSVPGGSRSCATAVIAILEKMNKRGGKGKKKVWYDENHKRLLTSCTPNVPAVPAATLAAESLDRMLKIIKINTIVLQCNNFTYIILLMKFIKYQNTHWTKHFKQLPGFTFRYIYPISFKFTNKIIKMK